MSNKFWDRYSSWDDAERNWEKGSTIAAEKTPIESSKGKDLPLSIHSKTKRFLKWKTAWYFLSQDTGLKLTKHFFKYPLKYAFNFIKSLLRKKPYQRINNLYLYGFKTIKEFQKEIPSDDNILIVGFGYCHKPLECPDQRFSEQCRHDPDNPICRQCFIGKCMNTLPNKNVVPLVVTTVHYIGEKVTSLIEKHPNKNITFIMTVCELGLEMFSDWGNMVNVKGVGIKLCGRVCTTLETFKYAERGIKPHLTDLLESDKKQLLELLQLKHV
jgi:hypothetical protein